MKRDALPLGCVFAYTALGFVQQDYIVYISTEWIILTYKSSLQQTLVTTIILSVGFSLTSEIDGGGVQHKGVGAVLTHHVSLLG
jgi:hypothetical protein